MVENLEHAGFRLVVRPEVGGSIARFDRQDGRPILHPLADLDAGGVEGGGCFPLVPFSNRMRSGTFVFGGRDLAMEPNIPDTGRVVHGLGWRAKWTVAARDPNVVTITHRHDGGQGWSWRYQATQRFELDDRGLRVALTLTNMSAEPMPAGLGLHPYFPLHAETRLRLDATGCKGVGDDGFPIAIEDEPGQLARLAEATLPRHSLYISGVVGNVTLVDGRSLVIISTSPNLTHLVVHRPADGAFLCVEPTSHRVGALNASGHAAQTAAGISTLAEGETLQCWMRISPKDGDE